MIKERVQKNCLVRQTELKKLPIYQYFKSVLEKKKKIKNLEGFCCEKHSLKKQSKVP